MITLPRSSTPTILQPASNDSTALPLPFTPESIARAKINDLIADAQAGDEAARDSLERLKKQIAAGLRPRKRSELVPRGRQDALNSYLYWLAVPDLQKIRKARTVKTAAAVTYRPLPPALVREIRRLDPLSQKSVRAWAKAIEQLMRHQGFPFDAPGTWANEMRNAKTLLRKRVQKAKLRLAAKVDAGALVEIREAAWETRIDRLQETPKERTEAAVGTIASRLRTLFL